ncbi:hypothetical protein [Aeromonas phage SW69-9]|uniref:Uncharacterized protein n=1 Tax=Aeromonas phage 44RR2.8t.2 TaxID=1932900 RepID=A0A219Y9E3_9CAUD|nr:hypothetical protein [Aeromonas phage 44RR2.8t.2]APU02173.1 hypothetical protein [Aeromonas phage Riv-10]APU02420.1 hypothetical protein [Aeromonas phage SW69-9]
MLLVYQVIAVIVFICSFLGDYKRYSDTPSEVFGNIFGSLLVGLLWPLAIVIRFILSLR